MVTDRETAQIHAAGIRGIGAGHGGMIAPRPVWRGLDIAVAVEGGEVSEDGEGRVTIILGGGGVVGKAFSFETVGAIVFVFFLDGRRDVSGMAEMALR